MKELFWKKAGKALALLHQPLKRRKQRSEGEQKVDSWQGWACVPGWICFLKPPGAHTG